MMGGRKPAANASATGESAPKAALGTANALGPPAGANLGSPDKDVPMFRHHLPA